MHLVGYSYEAYHDAQSLEHKEHAACCASSSRDQQTTSHHLKHHFHYLTLITQVLCKQAAD
jgi:hypothetical protein